MLANAWEYTAKDQFLHCLPLHHIQIPLFLFPIMLFTFSLLLQCVFVWDKWITISFGLKSRLILNLYYTCAWTFQCFTCPSLCRFHGNYSKIISLLQTFFTYSIHAVWWEIHITIYACPCLKVDFVPKFSVRGIWQRWRESYPADGTIADNAITVFTGVSLFWVD